MPEGAGCTGCSRARAETVTGRLRRMAFTQAHIDLVAAAPETGLCLDAVAAMHRLVCRLTGISASSVRVRVGDSRAWTSLLGPHARPRAIRDLRQDFLDPPRPASPCNRLTRA